MFKVSCTGSRPRIHISYFTHTHTIFRALGIFLTGECIQRNTRRH